MPKNNTLNKYHDEIVYGQQAAYNIVITFLIYALVVINLFQYMNTPIYTTPQRWIVGCSIVYVLGGLFLYCIHISSCYDIKGQTLTIAFLFLSSFFIVHFLNYISWLLDWRDVEFLEVSCMNKASLLSSCTFNAVLIGLLLPKQPFKGARNERRDKIRIPWWIMGISLSLFIIFTDSRYFSAGGNAEVLNNIGWNPIGLASYIICSAYVMANVIAIIYNGKRNLSFSKYIRQFNFKFYILAFIFLAIVLISGDRGPMIDIFGSFALGYIIINKKRIRLPIIIGVAIVGAFALTYLSILRGSSQELSLEKIEYVNDRMDDFRQQDMPLLESMGELSNVVNSYHLVYNFAYNNFIIYGMGVFIQIMAFLPGFRFLFVQFLGIPSVYFSTDILATMLLGQGYGAGTTCVADAFYNFGEIGTIFFFIFVGWFVKKLDWSLYLKQTNLLVLTIAFCYMIKAIYIGRSFFLTPINVIVYTFLILVLSKYLTRQRVAK